MGLDDLKRAMEQRRLFQEAQANGSLPVGAPDNMLRQNMQANPQTPGILQQFSNLGNTMMDRSSELRNDPLGALKRAAQNAITGIGADPTTGQARLPGTDFIRQNMNKFQEGMATNVGDIAARANLPEPIQAGMRGLASATGAGLEVVKEHVAPDVPSIAAAIPLIGAGKAVAGKAMSVFRPKLTAEIIFKKQGKMSPDQVRAVVRNLGAKEEASVAKIETFLKGKKSVSKADFEAHLSKNGLALEERVLGDAGIRSQIEAFDEEARFLNGELANINHKIGLGQSRGDDVSDLVKAQNQVLSKRTSLKEKVEDLEHLGENSQTRWGRNGTQGDYTIPGPIEKDIEILVKSPIVKKEFTQPVKAKRSTIPERGWIVDYDDGMQRRVSKVAETEEDAIRMAGPQPSRTDGGNGIDVFKDLTHWPDDPNTMLWVRTNLRKFKQDIGMEKGIVKKHGDRWRVFAEGSDTHQQSFSSEAEALRSAEQLSKSTKMKESKIQFLEELQSSWHQKARELWKGEVNRIAKAKGISKGEAAKEVDSGFGYSKERITLPQIKERFKDDISFLKRNGVELELGDQDSVMAYSTKSGLITDAHEFRGDIYGAELGEIKDIVKNINEAFNLGGTGRGVPDAPFKKTGEWASVGLKRWLREGADNDAEFMAWTTGKQQIDRYDDAMRKNVDFIEWGSSNAKGEIDEAGDSILVTAIKGEESVFAERFSKATGKSERAIQSPTGSEIMDLSEVVGKSTAEKIMASPEGKLKDLSIGGEGMKNFYDVMVPKFLKEIFKKNGLGKVEFVDVPIANSEKTLGATKTPFNAQPDPVTGEWVLWDKRNGSVLKKFGEDMAEAAKSAIIENNKFIESAVHTQPAIKLTPEQRKKIQEGLLLSDVGGEDDGERVA